MLQETLSNAWNLLCSQIPSELCLLLWKWKYRRKSEPALGPRQPPLECRMSHTRPFPGRWQILHMQTCPDGAQACFQGRSEMCASHWCAKHCCRTASRTNRRSCKDVDEQPWEILELKDGFLTPSYWYCMVFPWLEMGGSPASESRVKEEGSPLFLQCIGVLARGKTPL